MEALNGHGSKVLFPQFLHDNELDSTCFLAIKVLSYVSDFMLSVFIAT